MAQENDSSVTSPLTNTPLDGTYSCLSRSGSPTLLVNNPANRPYFLHSPQDPMEEAVSLLGDRRFHDGDVTILFGFGLGYLVQAIRKRMGRSHDLIVIEQRPDIFATALDLLDLKDILSDPRIRLCVGIDSHTVIEALKEIHGKAVIGNVQKLSYGPAVDLAPEAYRKLENEIELYVCELKTSLHSFRTQIPVRLANLFGNLPVLCQSTPVTGLKKAFTGLPAVVVAAGPSLDKNIRALRGAWGKVPIIAVDAALKPLLASGITPDIIATLDPLDKNAEKVSGLLPTQLKDIGLVFAPEGNRAIPKLFTGPRFFTNSQNTFADWLISHFGAVPEFPPMYTVSHLAFFVARFMGCDPIILTGFDFSFPENRHHSKDCATTWTVDFEKWEFVEIEDIHGGKVKTFDHFLYMLRLMEREINKTEALCIDATEGGARIGGTTILPLEEALSTYVPQKQTEMTLRLKEMSALSQTWNRKNFSQGLSWLDSERKHASEIITSANFLIEQANQVDSLDGPAGDKILTELGAMKKQITERRVFIDVLGDLISDLLIHEARSNGKAKSKLSPDGKSNQETLQSYQYFFSQLDEILILLAETCPKHVDVDTDKPFEKSRPPKWSEVASSGCDPLQEKKASL